MSGSSGRATGPVVEVLGERGVDGEVRQRGCLPGEKKRKKRLIATSPTPQTAMEHLALETIRRGGEGAGLGGSGGPLTRAKARP